MQKTSKNILRSCLKMLSVGFLAMFTIMAFMGYFDIASASLASGFAFMNLVSRPMGGWFSDKFGRRRSMLVLIAGLAAATFLFLGWLVSLALPTRPSPIVAPTG